MGKSTKIGFMVTPEENRMIQMASKFAGYSAKQDWLCSVIIHEAEARLKQAIESRGSVKRPIGHIKSVIEESRASHWVDET